LRHLWYFLVAAACGSWNPSCGSWNSSCGNQNSSSESENSSCGNQNPSCGSQNPTGFALPQLAEMKILEGFALSLPAET